MDIDFDILAKHESTADINKSRGSGAYRNHFLALSNGLRSFTSALSVCLTIKVYLGERAVPRESGSPRGRTLVYVSCCALKRRTQLISHTRTLLSLGDIIAIARYRLSQKQAMVFRWSDPHRHKFWHIQQQLLMLRRGEAKKKNKNITEEDAKISPRSLFSQLIVKFYFIGLVQFLFFECTELAPFMPRCIQRFFNLFFLIKK